MTITSSLRFLYIFWGYGLLCAAAAGIAAVVATMAHCCVEFNKRNFQFPKQVLQCQGNTFSNSSPASRKKRTPILFIQE